MTLAKTLATTGDWLAALDGTSATIFPIVPTILPSPVFKKHDS